MFTTLSTSANFGTRAGITKAYFRSFLVRRVSRKQRE